MLMVRRVGEILIASTCRRSNAMPIAILCPGCKKNLKAPDGAAGKKVKCPQCNTVLAIPSSSAVEDPLPPPQPLLRPTKQPNRSVLFLSLGLGVAGIVLVLIIGVVTGLFWSFKGNQQVVAKGQTTNPGEEKREKKAPSVKAVANSEKEPATDTTKKEQLKLEKERVEKARLEEERTQEEAIRNATVLQAPPLEKGKYHETGDFGRMMKDLAENEFKFREAKGQVYRSTFNQRTLENTPILKRFHARNAVVTPGRYDFGSGTYFLDLMFWQALYLEKKMPEDVVNNPTTNDICLLNAALKVDAKTAQRWREAIDQGTFSLTVWYRFVKVERGTWRQNPHWNPVPMLAHDIAFNVDVLKFEESILEPVDPPKVEPNPGQPKEAASPVSIARKRGDDYVRSIEGKGLMRGAVFTGIYRNPKGEDSYAVCYTVSEVNRKPVRNQPVHVFVFKDQANTWRISAFSSDGIHVALGPPPSGFTKVVAPKGTK